MGFVSDLFTGIGADLTYAFASGTGVELTEDQKAYYRHVHGDDRTEQEKHLLCFLKEKYHNDYITLENDIYLLKKYTNDYTNIPYNKIFKETGNPKHYIDDAVEAIKEYQKYCDEQHYYPNVVSSFLNSTNQNSETENTISLPQFLQDRFGDDANEIETIIDTIDEYTDDYSNIPFDIIYNEKGISEDKFIQAKNALKEYLDQYNGGKKAVMQVKAIQNITKLLDFLEKEINGNLSEQEKCSLKESAERWKADIKILRNFTKHKKFYSFKAREDREDMVKKDEAMERTKANPEEAIQDIKELLKLLEKGTGSDLSEQEQCNLKENTKKWKESIVILRNYCLCGH